MAVAALGSKSTNVIDRLAFSVNSEQAVRALNDALRTIATLQSQGDVIVRKVSQEGREFMKIEVKSEGNKNITYSVYGTLPTPEEVQNFINEVSKDPRLARKIGAIALDIYVKALEEVG